MRERLMEALRRDVDTLTNPTERAKLSPDIPELIQERIDDYRRRLTSDACVQCGKPIEDTPRVIALCDQCIRDGGPPGWEVP